LVADSLGSVCCGAQVLAYRFVEHFIRIAAAAARHRRILLVVVFACCVTPAATMEGLIDTRQLGKPKVFDGSSDSWRDWSFQFTAWVSLLDARFSTSLPQAASWDAEIPPESDPEKVRLSSSLYYVLVMLTAGAALNEVRAAPLGHGAEAWRRLSRRYEPRTRNYALTLLQQALNPDLSGSTAEQIRDKLLLWEEAMTRYEKSSASTNSLSDDIKIATLLRALPEAPRFALLQYLGTQPATVPWSTVRDYLVTYLNSAAGWRGPDDMDVSALEVSAFTNKGKGKGKGKEDGKGSPKPKPKPTGKAKPKFEGKCNWCQKQGHKEADCFSKKNGKPKVAALTEESGRQEHAASSPPQGGGPSGAASSSGSTLPSSASAVNRVGALHVAGSAQNPLWLYGLHEEIAEVQLACGALSSDSDPEWVLLDSGSMIHACRPEDASDVATDPSRGVVLQAVDGSQVEHHGTRTVRLALGQEQVPTQLEFQVADVAYPLLSLGRILGAGAELHMSGRSGYIQHQGARCSVEVRRNVLMVQARRHGHEPQLVAPLADEQFDP
jgi:hypothetical protein